MKTSARLDYLIGVIDLNGSDYQSICGLVGKATAADLAIDTTKPIFRGQRWHGSGVSAVGVMAAMQLGTDGEPAKLWLSIPGKPLGAMSSAEHQDLLAYLVAKGFRATRLDVALDVPHDTVGLAQLREATTSGAMMGFRSYSLTESKQRGVKGWTVYLGAAGADRRLCIYDKRAESRGRVDAVRMELRLNDDVAVAAVGQLMHRIRSSGDEWASWLARMVIGAVDFREANGARYKNERPQLDWWARITEYVGAGVRPTVRRMVRTLEDGRAWLQRQVLPTIEIIARVFGANQRTAMVDWLYDQWEYRHGPDRQRRVDRMRLELFAAAKIPCGA